jgi:thiol-disulfide isomerase/thioredoxin
MMAVLLILMSLGLACGRSSPPAPATGTPEGAAGGGPASREPGPAPAEAAAPGAPAPAAGGAAAGGAGAAVPAAQAWDGKVSITYVDLDGLRSLLATRRAAGRPVLVNFWATWCTPCVRELPELGDLAREFGDAGPEIIGVSLDFLTVPEKERVEPKVRGMLSEAHVSYANMIVTGDQGAFVQAFGFSGGIPYSVLYDGAGRAVQRWTGSIEPDEVRRAVQDLRRG